MCVKTSVNYFKYTKTKELDGLNNKIKCCKIKK